MTTQTENSISTPVRSMTGFAQVVAQEDGFLLTVSLRSVNHKTLDLHLNLPEQLQRFEPLVRKEIATLRPRGHLQLKVTLERETAGAPAVNEALVGHYIELFRGVAEHHGLTLETALNTLAHLPGVIASGGSQSSSNSSGPMSPQIEAAFLSALRETLEEWDQMRAGEGAVLEDDLRNRALLISSLLERLEQLREEMLPLAQKKLRDRLQSWLEQNPLDPARVSQEAATLGERTDVSEEILRLKAHFAQFLGLLSANPETGKKLDFLLQEIQRELNTTLAKTAGLGESGLGMTQLALEIKAEAEKLREQVQNVQ
jgi:uncharacterized protein (TIGR00255 family)